MGEVDDARVRVVGRRPEPECRQVFVEHLAHRRSRTQEVAGSGSNNLTDRIHCEVGSVGDGG